MGISLASGVSASSGFTPATWPTNTYASGTGTVQGIVSANGTYNKYVPGVTVVASSNIKSHALAAGDNTTALLLDTINIPPNVVGPDGWLELDVDWGCNSSANAKTITPVYWLTNGTCLDSQTTNISSHFTVRISNRNNTHVQMLQSNNPGSGLGGSTSAVQSMTMFMDSGENTIALYGTVTAAGGSDSVWIERWTLKAYNPTVWSANRLNYGKVQFWGANAHFDDTQSIAQHISDLKTMGMKTMRMAYEFGSSLTTLIAYATAIQTDNTGIQMCVCLDVSLTSDGTNLWTSEQLAYNYALSTAMTVVSALAPLGVLIYEAGNEMDTKNGINISDPLGGFASDFSNTVVPIFRGLQRGCIDGVHAAHPGALCASNAYTQCSIGLADMMWLGTQPDGSSGHPVVRWDLTNWHNYEDYGPMVGIPRGASAGYCNMYEHLNRTYGGVPIIVTEWNGKSSDTDPQRANWASRWMGEAYNNRYKYNIAFVCVYEMYGTPWNILTGTPGQVESTFGTTVQTFITNNPDTGL
jgi:hypothetical protein